MKQAPPAVGVAVATTPLQGEGSCRHCRKKRCELAVHDKDPPPPHPFLPNIKKNPDSPVKQESSKRVIMGLSSLPHATKSSTVW
jgi:hypothetical protein